MLDIFYEHENLIIKNSQKNQIVFNTKNNEVFIDDFLVSYPWEYEKSSILLEVLEYQGSLFYNFLNSWKHVVIVTNDNFELKEEILSFFGDVDLLIIIWSKNSAKIFESIEAKVVIPYDEGKDVFLNTLWQHIEEVSEYKMKWELPLDATTFVNLWNA